MIYSEEDNISYEEKKAHTSSFKNLFLLLLFSYKTLPSQMAQFLAYWTAGLEATCRPRASYPDWPKNMWAVYVQDSEELEGWGLGVAA